MAAHYKNYKRIAQRIAAKYGIPPKIFLALVAQESNWNPNAKSSAGALGLTQLMPGTAAGLGVDPRNPQQNLEGGARYLRQQFDRFGSWRLALAAYNAGPGNVRKYGGIPPFAETQHYVRTILEQAGAASEQPVHQISGTDTSGVQAALASNASIASGQFDPISLLSELATLSPPTSPTPPTASPSSPGLEPSFATRLQQLIAAVGDLSVSSGYRSVAEQETKWQEALKKYGSPEAARKWVAPPGQSFHNKGLAADLAGNLNLAHKLAPRFGLAFPMSWEPWHIEPEGTR